MMSQTHQDAESGPLLLPPKMPAPRVKVRTTEKGQAIEAAFEQDGTDFRAAFLGAFGTTEEIAAGALYEQLLNALAAASGRSVDPETANLAIALVGEIGPKDTIEAMLASQMVVAHVAAMDAARRALHAEQTPAGRQAYLSLARKLMTLFTAQMDALTAIAAKRRCKGS
jgi:hypothetical protein